MREPVGVKDWFKGESKKKMYTHRYTQTQTHTHRMKNAEINFAKDAKLFSSKRTGREDQLYLIQIKFICISMNKNYLYYYQPCYDLQRCMIVQR